MHSPTGTYWAQALVRVGDPRILSRMSGEVLYVLRKDAPDFQDLDAVMLLASAVTDDGVTIPAGTEGTVVGVWSEPRSCIVEFAEPDGALATVPATDLMRVVPTTEK